MKFVVLGLCALVMSASMTLQNDEAIESAMSAGPDSITAEATVKDWNMKTLREGSNAWTCLCLRSNTPGGSSLERRR